MALVADVITVRRGRCSADAHPAVGFCRSRNTSSATLVVGAPAAQLGTWIVPTLEPKLKWLIGLPISRITSRASSGGRARSAGLEVPPPVTAYSWTVAGLCPPRREFHPP